MALFAAVCTSIRADSPLPVDPEAGLPFIDVFAPRDYRGHFQIWDIVEDANGLLYFGNLNKVLRYDGARWSHFDVPDAAFVRGLALDAEDTLWLGGVDELGYARSDPTGQRTFVSLKAQVPPEARMFGNIWKVAVTPTGILFQSSTWLLRWDGQRFVTLPLPDSPRWRLCQVGTEWWVSEFHHGWFRVRDDGQHLQLEPLPLPPELADQRATGATADPTTGTVIIGTDHQGLWRWDGTTFTPFPTAIDPALRADGIYAVTGLRDGRIALSSLRAGVRILDSTGRPLTHLEVANGLPDNTALSLFAAPDGRTLWAGLALGAVRIDVRPWLSWYGPANGAPRSKFFTPLRYHERLLVPGDSGGLLTLIPATTDTPAHLQPVADLAFEPISLTTVDDHLVLTASNGIFELDGANHAVALPASPNNATDFFPLPAPANTWAALNNNTVRRYRREGTSWIDLGEVPGLARVRGISVDLDGSWWLGRPVGGVLHARFTRGYDQPPEVEVFDAGHGLPADHAWTRFVDDIHGPLLTCNVGLLRFDAKSHQFLPTTEYGRAVADGSTHVNGSTADEHNGLWMILRPRDEAEAGDDLRLAYGRAGRLTTLRIPHLTLIDDPSHLLHEPAAAGRPETLWIVGHGAMVRLNLDLWRTAPPEPPPELRIRALSTGNGRILPLVGKFELPFNDRSLLVKFASTNLGSSTGTTYESTLLSRSGLEVLVNQTPERSLSALGAGDYRFSLRAHTPGGDWSPPVNLTFAVIAPWWFRWPALLAYVAGTIACIVLIWRIRVRGLMQRQTDLEEAVAARTAELASQNAELHRLRQIEFNEKLAARLTAENARLEVLRYQLNPHFLFNTLNAICAQIIKAPRTARETVIRLAEFCRLTLHRPDENAAPSLGEEIRMLRAYLEIEQTRLGELLDYRIDNDPLLDDLRLPPFLLIPLVENAVKYGAATSHDRVHVRLRTTQTATGDLVIEVINSGHWIEPANPTPNIPSLGIGLENLRQRLARYYPDRHEFVAEPNAGWVAVRLTLRQPERPLSS